MELLKFNINDFSPEQYAAAYALLQDEKRQRVDRMRFEADKRRSVAGDLLARSLLSKLLSIDPDAIRIKTTASGKPYIEGTDLHISIAHSCDYAVCAAGTNQIGADIEKIRKTNIRAAKRVCSQDELDYILAFDTDSRFFRLWTLKEAYAKAVGTGILSKESKIEFHLTDDTERFENDSCFFQINSELPGYLISVCEIKAAG